MKETNFYYWVCLVLLISSFILCIAYICLIVFQGKNLVDPEEIAVKEATEFYTDSGVKTAYIAQEVKGASNILEQKENGTEAIIYRVDVIYNDGDGDATQDSYYVIVEYTMKNHAARLASSIRKSPRIDPDEVVRTDAYLIEE